MHPHRYRTPRYVWVASAIAATTLHGLGLWWIMIHWQSSLITTPPASIAVVPIPSLEPTASLASDLPTATSANVSAPPEAAAASPPANSSPDNGQTPSVAPSSTATTPPNASPTQPLAADGASLAEPSTTPPSPLPGTAEASQPSQTSQTKQPIQENIEGAENTPSRFITSWGNLELISGARDLPDEPPTLPPEWKQMTSQVVEQSPCIANLVLPMNSVTVLLWPEIGDGGEILRIQPVDVEGATDSDKRLIQCIDSLKNQIPRLNPATVAGTPISTYSVQLSLTINVAESSAE